MISRSKKTKEQIFKDSFSLFVNKKIPKKLLNGYMNDEDGLFTFELQEWIVNNLRPEISDWCTGIGVIDAVEILYESAVDNGRLFFE